MKKVAIVYHSGFGHTAVQAKHVHQGAANVEGVEAELIKVADVTDKPTKLNQYDAIIFGAPTYMGSLSAPFKAFMDATAKLWYSRDWKDKLAAGFTNSASLSGDKLNSLLQLVVFASQQGMIWVSQDRLNESADLAVQSGDPEKINRVGSYLGAMTQSENDSPDVTPQAGDLKTAELLGKRVAEAALRWG